MGDDSVSIGPHRHSIDIEQGYTVTNIRNYLRL
jgi:hypothetical protein